MKSSSGKYFISTQDSKAIFTKKAILALLTELKLRYEDRVGLAEDIFTHRRTILAILVYMRQEGSIINFRTHDIRDSALPLRDVQVANGLVPGLGNQLVIETQWKFIPYSFEHNVFRSHREIGSDIILPFIKEESFDGGAFGEVSKVTIPASHHQFKLDPDLVRSS
jgi:hypothetical protein